MEDCLFCKIVVGKIPCHKVYEDKDTLSFLDVHPHASGHTVIIPKKHGETVLVLDKETNSQVMSAVVNTMNLINKVLNPDGFNVGWNHNSVGGQVVPHLHVHILPRYQGDGGGSMHSIVKNPGKLNIEEIAALFKKVKNK